MRRFWAPIALATGATASLLVFPSAVSAHGLVGRLDLPVPQWLFAWTAAVVLVVAFVGLAVAWREPRLETAPSRATPRVPFVAEAVLSGFGLVAFVVVGLAGLFGEQEPATNIEPTAMYVVFWVVVPVLSLVVGDVFASLSPWRTLGRIGAHIGLRPRRELRAYPERIGRWPAAAGLLIFAWVELAAPFGDEPRVVALLALAYAATQLVGIARYGVEPWTRHADAFGVAFSLIAAMSPLHWARRTLSLRLPLSGLAQLSSPRGTVAVLCAMIGTTSFDGASQGGLWTTLTPDLVISLADAGLSRDTAQAIVDPSESRCASG